MKFIIGVDAEGGEIAVDAAIAGRHDDGRGAPGGDESIPVSISDKLRDSIPESGFG